MSNIKDTLKNRLEQLKDHEPTISIFKGRQRIISWGGEQTVECSEPIRLDTNPRLDFN